MNVSIIPKMTHLHRRLQHPGEYRFTTLQERKRKISPPSKYMWPLTVTCKWTLIYLSSTDFGKHRCAASISLDYCDTKENLMILRQVLQLKGASSFLWFVRDKMVNVVKQLENHISLRRW